MRRITTIRDAEMCIRDWTERYSEHPTDEQVHQAARALVQHIGGYGQDAINTDTFALDNALAGQWLAVVEDNGGGLTLYVVEPGPDNEDRVIYAHAGYEAVDPQHLRDDIEAYRTTGTTADWEGNDEARQQMWDELDDYEHGWEIVARIVEGRLRLNRDRMGAAARRVWPEDE